MQLTCTLLFIDTLLWVTSLPRIGCGQGKNGSSQLHLLFGYPWPNFSSIVWTHTLTSRRALPHSLPISHPCSSLSHTTCLSIYTVESVCHWQHWAIRKIESSCIRNTSFHLAVCCLKRRTLSVTGSSLKVFKKIRAGCIEIISLLSNKQSKVGVLQRAHHRVPSGMSSASAVAPEKARCITPAGYWSIGVWFQMAGVLRAQCGAQHSQVDNNGNTQRHRCPC